MPDLNRFFGDIATGMGEQGKLLKILWEKLNTPTIDFPGEDDFVSNLGEDASTPLSLLLGAGGLYGGAKMAGRAFDRMVNAPVDPARRGFLKATGAGAGGAAASMMSTGKRAVPEPDDIDRLKELLRVRQEHLGEAGKYGSIFDQTNDKVSIDWDLMDNTDKQVADIWNRMLTRGTHTDPISKQIIPRDLMESGRRREIIRTPLTQPEILDLKLPRVIPKKNIASHYLDMDENMRRRHLLGDRMNEGMSGFGSDTPIMYNRDGTIRSIDKGVFDTDYDSSLYKPQIRDTQVGQLMDDRLQSEKWVDAIKRRWLGAGP